MRPIFHPPDDARQNDHQLPLLLAEEASYRRVRVRSQREPLMKKTAFVSSALAVLFASVTAHAEAQVTVDVSKITCDQLLSTRSPILNKSPLGSMAIITELTVARCLMLKKC